MLATNSFTNLSPTYIADPPRKDGWQRFLQYALSTDSQAYSIRCLGRDGNATAIICGTTTNFNDDIVYSNGTFLQWPEGSQN